MHQLPCLVCISVAEMGVPDPDISPLTSLAPPSVLIQTLDADLVLDFRSLGCYTLSQCNA
jgi:hypothetical protein